MFFCLFVFVLFVVVCFFKLLSEESRPKMNRIQSVQGELLAHYSSNQFRDQETLISAHLSQDCITTLIVLYP